MDIQMPIMNGNEACNIIRQTDKDIPIYAMTGNTRKEELVLMVQTGFTDIISKPFNKAIIKHVLSAHFPHIINHTPTNSGISTTNIPSVI
jgi:CheY-like chemotaxis protein